MSDELQNKIFNDGSSLFEKTKKEHLDNDLCPYQEAGWQRSAFYDGYFKAKDSHVEKLTEQFKNELTNLCKKYNVNLSTGCGCCGGCDIEDENGNRWEFSI